MNLSRRQLLKAFGTAGALAGMGALAGCNSDPAASSDDSASKVATIKDRGKLNCGVKADVLGYGYLNTETGEYEGLEIEFWASPTRRPRSRSSASSPPSPPRRAARSSTTTASTSSAPPTPLPTSALRTGTSPTPIALTTWAS